MSNKRALDAALDPSSSPSSPTGKAVASKPKKVKFVIDPSSGPPTTSEPVDDVADLEFDELNQVGKIRKGRVKVEGYDSDSSTENTDVRQEKNKKPGDGDEDMFGADQDPTCSGPDFGAQSKFDKIDVGMELKKGAEAKDYLDLGDIEGQEFGREEEEENDAGDDRAAGSRGLASKTSAEGADAERDSDNGYSDEEEDFVPGDEFANADDAPRARRKSKRGMGFMLSKFNMAEELTEGRMTADGSYVASVKDPEAVHDNWLEGVNSKKTIKLAREAKMRRDEESRKRAAIDDSLASHRSRKDCYIALLALLPAGGGRTVSQILCQLGNDKRAHQQTEKRKIAKKTIIDRLVPDSMVVTSTSEEPGAEKAGKEVHQTAQRSDAEVRIDRTIAEITDLASTLMGTHGDLDIYDMTHGSITGILKSEGLVPRDWTPPSNSAIDSPTKSSDVSEIASTMARKSLITRPTTATQPAPMSASGSVFYRFKTDPTKPGSVPTDGSVYGPFDRAMMEGWASQGFFGADYEHIQVKLDVSPAGSAPWGTWTEIMNC